MHQTTGTDERTVETALREILEPLDRQLARVTMFFPLALVTIVPTVFFILWLGYDFTGRRALVMSGGVCCSLVALYLSWEILASRLALRRFDRRFPPTTPARAIALGILTEMETPSKAEEKLRTALASISPDRIVRHRREPQDHTDTLPIGSISTDPPTIKVGPSPQPSEEADDSGRRPGGYYDYIPLEPRPRDEGIAGEQRA